MNTRSRWFAPLWVALSACTAAPPPPASCGDAPCSVTDEPPEAALAADRLQRRTTDRLLDGATLADAAAMVAADPLVLEHSVTDTALVFRMANTRPRWISRVDRTLDFFVADHARDTQSATEPLVTRPANVDALESKEALLLAPFEHPSFGSAMIAQVPRLRAVLDYRAGVRYQPHNHGLQSFAAWNHYQFVWLTTHGEIATVDGRISGVIATGVPCGVDGYLAANPAAMFGATRAATVLERRRAGATSAQIIAMLGADGPAHWQEIERRGTALTRQLSAGHHGATCFSVQAHIGAAAEDKKHIEVMGLDDAFWAQHYPRGLGNTVVILDACRAAAVQIPGGTPSRIIGWSEYVRVSDSITSVGDMVQQLAAGVSVDQLRARGAQRYTHRFCSASSVNNTSWPMTCTNEANQRGRRIETEPLLTASGSSGDDLRIREVVRAMPTDAQLSFDELPEHTVDAVHRANHWDIALDATVEGFTRSERPMHRVGLRVHNGPTIVTPVEVPEERSSYATVGDETNPAFALGRARWTLNASVPELWVSTDETVDLELFASLPEGGESVDRFTVRLATPGPDQWQLRTIGPVAIALSGTLVSSTSAQAVNDHWPLQLLLNRDSLTAAATVVLTGHPGRRAACGGEAGAFDANLAIGTGRYTATGPVRVTITQFDSDALVASWNGTIGAIDNSRPMDGAVEVTVEGSMRWHRGGCNVDVTPSTTYVGAMHTPEAGVCTEYFSGSPISSEAIFRLGCDEANAGTLCLFAPTRCPSAMRIGSCSYRTPGAPPGLRDTIMHFDRLPEETTLDQLQLGCSTQNGTWIAP